MRLLTTFEPNGYLPSYVSSSVFLRHLPLEALATNIERNFVVRAICHLVDGQRKCTHPWQRFLV